MARWTRHVRGGAIAAASLLAIMAGALPAAAATHHSHHDGHKDATVPVIGTFAYPDGDFAGNDTDYGGIHAVVRIPHGTAVLYSVGQKSTTSLSGLMDVNTLNSTYGLYDLWNLGLVDGTDLKYYQPLVDADGTCLCSKMTDFSLVEKPAGTMEIGWAIMAPLPADVTHVTVDFGYASPFLDVPVTDSLPTPLVGGTGVVLGHGWPKLPSAASVPAANVAKSIRPLVRNVADPTATTHKSDKQESVDLNADVLFAYDKATLTSKAAGTLKSVAKKINGSASGTVRIVGYTDSTGSDAHNQTLSEQRAAAVKKALTPLVSDGDVSLTASGDGENDPVADNTTAQGRALNRRVTVSFTTGGDR